MLNQPFSVQRLTALTFAAACLCGAAPHPARAAPSARAITGAELKKTIQAYKGKTVVVNLWATWCEPCVAEFPELVKLYSTYKAKGVVFLAVSVDEPGDRAKVDAFTSKHNSDFPVVMRAKGSPEAFVAPLDKSWDGAVPTTYVFGRDGKQVGKKLTGLRTYAQFEAALKPALK